MTKPGRPPAPLLDPQQQSAMTITRGKPVDATERRSGPQLTVGELFVAVRQHWLLVLGAFMGGIAIAVIVSNAQTRIFESVATIYFDPRPPQPLGEKVEPVVDTSADYWNRKEYYNTQHWILSSRAILEPVAERLRLRWDPGFIRNKAGLERENEPVLSLDEVVGILVSRIRVQPIDDSRLARITVRDASPERARRILTALTELYLSQNESELMAATTEASKWLHNQLTTLKSDLDESEIDLHKYKKEKDLLSVSLDDQSGMLREEISQINVALTEAKTRRQHIAARSQQLADVDEKDPVNLPARELLESVVLQQLRAHYLEVSKELSGLLGEGKGENHPSVVASKARRDASKTALLDEIRNIKRSLEKDVRAADSEIGGLQSLYNRARAGALEVNQLEIEYRKLRRTRDTNERLLTLVTERAKRAISRGCCV